MHSSNASLATDDAAAREDAELMLPLIAYSLNAAVRMPIVKAPMEREWMEKTDRHFANRCLPMLISNQAGWVLLSGHKLAITWGGEETIDSLEIKYLAGEPPYPAKSHFGSGIVTWHVPYLFRTTLGFNLQVRGPANMPKDGISPLEGIVETDWSESTFTMNWKMTRPNHTVIFDVGEPIAMIMPLPRGELECFRPEIKDLGSDPELKAAYERWSMARRQFNNALQQPESNAAKQGWQKHYLRGASVSSSSNRPLEHQRKLSLFDFVDLRKHRVPKT
jgi:hypothetical protein